MKKYVFFIFATCIFYVAANAQVIKTIAGKGTNGFSGDGGRATDAELFYPDGAVIDGDGNFYFADENNNRIRKIDNKGIITTIAGTGNSGFSGDGGPASSAELSGPSTLALDASGNIYIADNGNQRVRKITTDGIISTIAGSGAVGYGGDGGNAINAKFINPVGVALDKFGNIYITDQGNNRIRKINESGIITTYAGNGEEGYLGDGAMATDAKLGLPTGIAIDANGNVFFSDVLNSCVRKINPSGIISTIAGNDSIGYNGDGIAATDAQLALPWGVAVDNKGNIFIADQNNFRVRKVNSNGIISTITGNGISSNAGDGGMAVNAALAYPWSVTLDKDGNIYISDWGSNCIRKITPGGTVAKNKNAFNLYPNPNEDLIEITQNLIEDYTADIKVMDGEGKAIISAQIEFKGGKGQLSVTDVHPGIYVIEIKDNKGKTETFRVAIEK